MNEQRNFILAIALSIAVLLGWQYFIGIPRMEREEARRAATETQQAESRMPAADAETAPEGTAPIPAPAPIPDTPAAASRTPAAVPVPGAPAAELARETALAASRRVRIETPNLAGSIALTGLRLDDLRLTGYHETVNRGSPPITLLSPVGSADPYYIEHGWTVAPGSDVAVPTSTTVWRVESGDVLAPNSPVTFAWDNGAGLTFRRTVGIDTRFMFTVTQAVDNAGLESVTLFPYALVSRHGIPQDITNFYILHEGLIGVMGEDGLHEFDYSDVTEGNTYTFEATGGWLGITDKYWAAVVAPDQRVPYKARFTSYGDKPAFQADYLAGGITVAPGAGAEVTSRTFAGAKEVGTVDGYEAQYGLLKFELLIDWGWFHFITKPLFLLLDWLNGIVGNFGVAILVATVLIKLVFFPLANKAYVSMSAMKKLQPEMVKLRERYKDDRMRQQQEMMALYKKEKVNPMSGCLPIVIQIPVFFALYKVLFVTIEMRHQPFFGWIRDLSAPDPTSLFNLFGLIPWDPPGILMIGIWPLIMGFTMFLQMRLNPAPPDPIQQQIFNWMPLFFTFLLAQFAAGLVIYWAWNNSLSVLQQYVIMRRSGVKVELWDNLRQLFKK